MRYAWRIFAAKHPSMKNRVKNLREDKGWTQSDLAERIGVTWQTISRIENAHTRIMPKREIPLARALGVDVDSLYSKNGTNLNSPGYAPNAVVGQPIDNLPTRALPVYGKAVGGTNGEFIMNGERTGLIPCPPQLLMVADAYAVEVRGDSMEPRYFDGETVVVNPERMPVKGDFVVVQIESDPSGPPHAFVKRFVRWTSESIVLEQYNPSTTLEFPSDQVVSVHYILTGRDLQG